MKKYDNDYLLVADFDRKVVSTNCGDFYLDYEISFDDLFKYVDFLKQYLSEMEKSK